MRQLKFMVLFIVLVIGVVFSAEAKPAPNIVFILADDLGITDICAYASHFTGKKTEELFYETPHMDRLVSKGISFSQAYANPLCSPTRASIMTGKNAARSGFTTATPLTRTYFNQNMSVPKGYSPHDVLIHKDAIKKPQAWINGCSNTGIDPNLMTLPKVLKGCRSVFIGKWHIGGHGVKALQPQAHGFETLAWFDAGGSNYYNRKAWNKTTPPYKTLAPEDYDVGDAGKEPHLPYLTDDLTSRAVLFINDYADKEEKKKNRKPFFLYLSHFAVHTPLQAPKVTIEAFEDKPQKGTLGHKNGTYAAMVKHLDYSVGRIMNALRQSGLSDNTLVVLTSDNGGAEYTGSTDNAPFKGGKATMYEGGVRVPLVYYMPGKYEGGIWCDSVVSAYDHLPTLAAITGNKIPDDLDGIDLTPMLDDPKSKGEDRAIIWHYPFNVKVMHPDHNLPLTPHSGMRKGDYKLLWDWHGKLELYDIQNDPFEEKDLAGEKPELRDSLFKELESWLAKNVKEHYFPKLNSGYDPAKDERPYPFKNLSKKLGKTAR